MLQFRTSLVEILTQILTQILEETHIYHLIRIVRMFHILFPTTFNFYIFPLYVKTKKPLRTGDKF